MSNVLMPSVLTVFAALTAGPALASSVGPLFAQQVLDCPDVDDITEGMDPVLAHVRYLADDALEGRGAGTSGARCAAQYIADQFEAIGLELVGPNGTYFQPFPIRAGAVLGARNTLRTRKPPTPSPKTGSRSDTPHLLPSPVHCCMAETESTALSPGITNIRRST